MSALAGGDLREEDGVLLVPLVLKKDLKLVHVHPDGEVSEVFGNELVKSIRRHEGLPALMICRLLMRKSEGEEGEGVGREFAGEEDMALAGAAAEDVAFDRFVFQAVHVDRLQVHLLRVEAELEMLEEPVGGGVVHAEVQLLLDVGWLQVVVVLRGDEAEGLEGSVIQDHVYTIVDGLADMLDLTEDELCDFFVDGAGHTVAREEEGEELRHLVHCFHQGVHGHF